MSSAGQGGPSALVRIGVVVPAAGRSRRMGRPKPLLPLGRSDFVGTILGTCQAVAHRLSSHPVLRLGPVAVVFRASDVALGERLRQLGRELPNLVWLAVELDDSVPEAEDALSAACRAGVGDMFWSLRQGAQALLRAGTWGAPGGMASPAEACAWVLVWPVDMPLASPDTVAALLDAVAAAADRPALLVPWSGGEAGHPVLVPASLLLQGQVGRSTPGGLAGRARATGLFERRVAVDDPGCGVGANTPEEYAWLCALWAHQRGVAG